MNYKLYFCYSVKNFHCYTDSDFVNNPVERKSVSGYSFKMFDISVSWMSMKQNIVTLSSTESEFVAVCTGVCVLLHLNNLFIDRNTYSRIIKVKLLKYFEINCRCKHIYVKLHFILG